MDEKKFLPLEQVKLTFLKKIQPNIDNISYSIFEKNVNYINCVSTFSFYIILVPQFYFCLIKCLNIFFLFWCLNTILFLFNQMSKLFYFLYFNVLTLFLFNQVF